uniref:EF-hand domain-containing protein n=1 Tax=Latimeria chalumnae TaxID=7897 RepID=H3BAP4_LATCH
PRPAPYCFSFREELSMLETAMFAICKVFHKYCNVEGNTCKLKKPELKELINNELPQFARQMQDSWTLDQLFTNVDEDGDLQISFQEFITLFSMVIVTCYKAYVHD